MAGSWPQRSAAARPALMALLALVVLWPPLAGCAARPPSAPAPAGPSAPDEPEPESTGAAVDDEDADHGEAEDEDESNAPTVAFSPPRGIVGAPLDVTLTADSPTAQIRTTTDGSAPTAERGVRYEGTIPITTTTVLRAVAYEPGQPAGPVATHTYVLAEEVLRQGARPPGWPATWGSFEGRPLPADYAMDPRVVDDPRTHDDLLATLRTLPTVSLAVDPADLFDDQRGLYVHPLERGREWERPASVELIATGEPGFQVDSGVRIHGNNSRRPEKSPKRSFRLVFRKEYGPGKLDYPVFSGSPVQDFDVLVLRAGLNDAIFVPWEHAQYIRDQWIRDKHVEMGGVAPRGRFVHLYLNGLYWGLYNLTERPDADFAAAHLGGSADEYDVISQGDLVDGELDAWNRLLEVAEDDPSADAATYAAMERMLAFEPFIDYVILSLYAGREDWPKANWVAARPRVDDGRFVFFSWDGEWSMRDAGVDRSGSAKDGSPGEVYSRLRHHPEFARRFAEHVARHVGPGGALYVDPAHPDWDPAHPERNRPAAHYAELAATVEDGMVAEAARWGDWLRPDTPFSRDDHWIPERDRLLREFFPQRTAVVLEQFRARGLLPTPIAPAAPDR